LQRAFHKENLQVKQLQVQEVQLLVQQQVDLQEQR
jgi:hypothetical protein